jgi:exonuclease III
MRIITWHCNIAFRKKADFILANKPDILIVPECERPDKLKFKSGPPEPNDKLWFGANPNKGLGIFSYSDFRLKQLDMHNHELKLIVPIAVTGGTYDFALYAVWANNPNDPSGQYVEQVWKAIKHYDIHLTNKQTILVGDFNSNTIWDRPSRVGNHSAVVKVLEEKGIFSSYHLFHKQMQGKEQHPTFYLYWRKDRPYHIDYCFVSADMANKIESVEIGDYDCWAQHSDHVPVIVTIKL